MTTHRAIFLDRDNTLIHNDGDLGDPALVKLIQGASAAIASVKGLGYKVIVVTNQGGVARGKYTEADVEAVNSRINDLVLATSGASIDRFYYCPYHPEATVEQYRREHPWRKPSPGMILAAIKDMSLDPTQCWMVGDKVRDIQAGKAAGLRTILLVADAPDQPPLRQGDSIDQLLVNHPEFTAGTNAADAKPDFAARTLIEAVRIVAQQRRPESLDEARLTEHRQRAQQQPAVAAPPTQTPAMPLSQPTAPSPVPAPRPAPPHSTSTPLPAVRAPVAATPVVPERPAPAEEPSPAQPVPAEQTLRHILQELRSLRPVHGEFSYLQTIAIVTQMIAVVCFLAGLIMGQSDINSFTRWLATAILAQLATIAILLFRR